MSRNKHKLAIIYTFLSILSWSFIPIVSKLAQTQIEGSLFLFYSNIFSFIAVIVYTKISHNKNFRFKIDNKTMFKTAYLGFLGCFLYYICIYYGYKVANPIEVIIIQYLWPILISILSLFLLKEKLTLNKIIALILGFLAVVIVIAKGDILNIHFDSLSGLVIVFLGAVSFALFSVLSKKEQIEPYLGVILFFAWASLFSLIWVIIVGKLELPNGKDMIFIMINGIIINGISYIWWIKALSLWQASKISILVFLTPVLATMWLMIFLNEKVFQSYTIALIFVIISGILTLRQKNANSKIID